MSEFEGTTTSPTYGTPETGYTPTERHNGHPRRPREHAPFGDLFTRLVDESRALLLLEVKLAKTEVSEKITQAQRGVTSLGTGGAILYAGFLCLLCAAIAGLSLIMKLWIAALAVGLVVCAIGYVVLANGRSKLKKENLKLTHTQQSLEEGKEWAKSQIH